MATFNVSWTPCGAASDGQFLYYGKTLVATGTPVSGTGWTLFSGAALANSVSSESITGLDDNVEYMFYIFCHCSTAGNGPLVNQGPLIKYVCPTVSQVTQTFNTVNYNLNVPASANNSGSWIQTIVVTLLNSAGTTVILTNTHTGPFATTIASNFTGLTPSTTYTLRVAYSNNSSSRTNICSNQQVTTAVTCAAPTVAINNITNSGFDVAFSPIASGDTFDILINSSVVATGLTVSPYTATGLAANTAYQVAVRKNCATGGNAISTAQNATTTSLTACAFEVTNLAASSINSTQMTITWTSASSTNGTKVSYRPCGSTTWLTPNSSGNYTGSYITSTAFLLSGMTAGTCLEILVQNACGSPSSYSNGVITSATSVQGTISASVNYRCSTNSCVQGETVLDFTFAQPTPAGGLILYAGWIETQFANTLAAGYDLFPLPAGVTNNAVYNTSQGDASAAFEIDIPGGITTFTTSSIIFQTVLNTLSSFNAWECFNQGCLSTTVTDIYLHIQAPGGYLSNFNSITTGITVHNV